MAIKMIGFPNLSTLLILVKVTVLPTVSLKHLVIQSGTRRVTDQRRTRKRTKARVIAINSIVANLKSWGLWHDGWCLIDLPGCCCLVGFVWAMGAIYRNSRMREVAALFSFLSF